MLSMLSTTELLLQPQAFCAAQAGVKLMFFLLASQGCGIRGVSSHGLAKISFKIEYVLYFILGRNEA